METAASISNRALIRHQKLAQKIIISHIKNYLGSILWGVNLIEDGEHFSVPLPTYRDYESLLSDLADGELFTPVSPSDGRVLVAVNNFYIHRKDGKKDGPLLREIRPEDEGMDDPPKVAYLVVNEKLLQEKNDRRFKCRDMKKFLEEVRTITAPVLIKETLENVVRDRINDAKKCSEKSYSDILKDSNYRKTTISMYSRMNKKPRKLGRPAQMTPKSVIRKDYFQDDRKRMDDTIRKLRRMGISLTPL